MPEKSHIRKEVKQRIAAMTEQEIARQSAEVMGCVEAHPFFRSARVVMLFWSMPGEVQTHSFIEKWCSHKTIVLPVMAGNDIVPVAFCGKDQMKTVLPLGVMEPSGEAFAGAVDLVIVPGLAFDRNNNRLGRGKGYYDRFLSSSQAYKMAVCFSCQMVDSVPADPHDVRMDEVIVDR